MRIIAKILVSATLLVVAGLGHASIINGDFDADVGLSGTAWNVYNTIPGWTTFSGHSIEVQHNTIVAAHSGDQYVELDSYANSSMYQEISGLTVGESYELSFWYHTRTNNSGNDNGISVYWGSAPLGDLQLAIDDLVSSQSNEWINFTLSLEATASNMFLGFAATGLDNSLGGFIDTVSFSSVPEPSSIALFTIGLFGLMLSRRRHS